MKNALMQYQESGAKKLKADRVTFEDIKNASDHMKRQIDNIPDTAVVLGSGLGHMADSVENPVFLSLIHI